MLLFIRSDSKVGYSLLNWRKFKLFSQILTQFVQQRIKWMCSFFGKSESKHARSLHLLWGSEKLNVGYRSFKFDCHIFGKGPVTRKLQPAISLNKVLNPEFSTLVCNISAD